MTTRFLANRWIRHAANLTFLLCTAAIAFGCFSDARTAAARGGAIDFKIFLLSAQRAAEDLSPYWRMPPRLSPEDECAVESPKQSGHSSSNALIPPPCLHPNLNPPFFVWLTLPLGKLQPERAWWVWWLGSVACGLAAVILCLKTIRDQQERSLARNVAVALGWSAYFPVIANLEMGQVLMPLLLLTVLAWRSARLGDFNRAGIWLGLAAAVKPFFLVFLPLLVVARAGKSAVALLLCCSAVSLVAVAAMGYGVLRDYLMVVSDVSWTTRTWNASIEGFGYRIFGGAEGVALFPAVGGARWFVGLASVAVLVLSFKVLGARAQQSSELRADAIFALSTTLMLLLSPLGWVYYFPLLVPAVWLVWASARAGLRIRMLLLAAFLPTIIPRGLYAEQDPSHVVYWALWDGPLYFYCLMTLWALVVIVLSRGG